MEADWQPIETAPRDCTPILIGRWSREQDAWLWIASGCIDGVVFFCDFTDNDFDPHCYHKATHYLRYLNTPLANPADHD